MQSRRADAARRPRAPAHALTPRLRGLPAQSESPRAAAAKESARRGRPPHSRRHSPGRRSAAPPWLRAGHRPPTPTPLRLLLVVLSPTQNPCLFTLWY